MSLIFYVPFSYTLNLATSAFSPFHKNSQCIAFSEMLKNKGEEKILRDKLIDLVLKPFVDVGRMLK